MFAGIRRGLIWPLRHWRLVPLVVALVLIILKMQPIDGWLGHDYYYSFIRIYIGAVHFWRNFPDLPHYTPSLCGGIPFFADPQSVYFSFLQILAFFIDPLPASFITAVVFYLLGYWGALKLFRQVFGYSVNVSHLGALAFCLNGFYFAHLYVGHLTHHTFVIFPWLLYHLFRRTGGRFDLFRQATFFSLILIYMFYAGAFHMLVVFFVCFLLAIPFLVYWRAQQGQLKQLVQMGGISALLLVLTCSGKFVASVLFSRHFIHAPIDSSGMPVAELVFKYFWFDPHNTPLFIQFGKYAFGPWEYVGFVSRLMIPAFLVFAFFLLKGWDRKKGAVVAAYALVIPAVCLLAAGSEWNTKLPFFDRYHNPIKILGAFVPWFAILLAYCLHCLSHAMKLSSAWLRTSVFLLLAIILVTEFNFYAQYFVNNKLTLAYVHVPRHYEVLKEQGGISRVGEIVAERGTDITGLRTGCTSLKCYEPLFGYQGERLRADLAVGHTDFIRDGKFNMTHPGCLLYPDYFGCKPWDRISADDRANFEKFVAGKTPDWGVPPWQSLLYTINFSILFLLWVPFAVYRLRRRGWSIPILRLPPLPIEEGASA